jgi:UDP-N-acetylmuramoylalanine--D-glutamate ligase
MSADLFAEISDIPCIGVTGTRGKSTVAHMLHAILKESGKQVLLGGNVRGVSTLSLLSEVTPEHIAILELDSWQLQGWSEAKISPHIAVFTTLYPDHLNYYKGDLDIYLADKANIFLYQKPEDTFIIGKQCAAIIIEKYGDKIKSKISVVDELKLPDTWVLRIPGLHNRYDAALALVAARTINIDDEVSRKALGAFAGVPGRLELIAEKNGIKIYNDTNSTTPEAAIAALRALGTNTVLIMGGDEKKLDMSGLIAEIPKWCSKVVLFKESGTNRIRDEIFALAKDDVQIYEEEGLEATIKRAFSIAISGETILYSPAFSSFGKYFKNEFDRGDQFNALVKELTT